MMLWMLFSNKYISVSHRNQLYAPSDLRLATSLMNLEFHPCGIFKALNNLNKFKLFILLHL